ncbi:MAG: LamG domain-containing protein, partial [Candidatus Solibacter sp.]
TGAIVAHVLRPTLSRTADDTIGMYYGGSQGSLQSVASQVWSATYKGVWHLANAPLGTDSTSNAANAISLNSTAGITGMISGGASLNGTSNYIDYGNVAGLNLGLSDITVSAWFKTSASGFAPILSKSRSADETGGRYCLYVLAGQVSFFLTGSPISGTYVKTVSSTASTYNDGNWHYAAATVSRIGNMILYIDGVSSGTPINFGSYSGVNLPNADKFYLGQYPDATGQAPSAGNYFGGTLDEVRVSIGTVRSPDWILTEYRNQNNPATYITAGPRVTPVSNSFRHSVRNGV